MGRTGRVVSLIISPVSASLLGSVTLSLTATGVDHQEGQAVYYLIFIDQYYYYCGCCCGHSGPPITPDFPSGSSRETVGDYVEKWRMLAHHLSHYRS